MGEEDGGAAGGAVVVHVIHRNPGHACVIKQI